MTVAETNTNNRRAVLRVRPGQFVTTPAIGKIVVRALRYLQSGFSIHLRGPAGTGKTTLALHLANCLTRPIMLIFGDDEFKSSDLIGNQSGYTHRKVLDNYIHNVVKMEEQLKQNWVDSRLTLACREGFTLVYDEFNRSRPEVNNVLLSALEEKILTLPPNSNQPEYLQVNAQFRAIFTSNPEEYCGVHSTQDALMDRLVTINVPEPDELTQSEILVQKTGINREEALLIVRLVKAFRGNTGMEKSSGLRSCLMIAKVCEEHDIAASAENADFRDICGDILFTRSTLSVSEATTIFWDLLNKVKVSEAEVSNFNDEANGESPIVDETVAPPQVNLKALPPQQEAIRNYLLREKQAVREEIQKAVNLNRTQTNKALRSLLQKGLLIEQDGLYTIKEINQL